MIPKSPRPDDFKSMIDSIRQQFSTTQEQTIGGLKGAFAASSHEVVESVDQVRLTNQTGTENIINNIIKNAKFLQKSLGNHGINRLVDINYDMVDYSDASNGLLKDIKDLQLGMASRSGLWGTFSTWIKSFKPFTNERRQKFIIKQRIAQNKLLRLTYWEQKATRLLLSAEAKRRMLAGVGTDEERAEFLKLMKNHLTGKRGNFSKKDEKALSPKTFLSQMKRLIGGVLALSAGGIAAIAMSFVTRYGQFGKAFAAIGKMINKWFMTSKIGVTIGAILLESVAKLGNLIDKSPALKKIADILLKDLTKSGTLAKVFGFLKKAGPFFKWIAGAGRWMAKAFGFLAKAGKIFVKSLPIIGKAVGTVGKFVPFLNILIAAYEIVRGAFKGVEKIGGVKGALTGIFGGILEFFTLGIFDMDAFLSSAKVAFEKFENGEFLSGLWELFKAPLIGMMSGVSWLGKKLLGGDGSLFKPDPEAGLVGKVLFHMMTPWRLMFTAIEWVVTKIHTILTKSLPNAFDKLTTIILGISDFFSTVMQTFQHIIDDPIGSIRKMINGTPLNEAEAYRQKNMKIRETAEGLVGGSSDMNLRIAKLMADGTKLKQAREIVQGEIVAEMREKRRMDIANQMGPQIGPHMGPNPAQIVGPPAPVILSSDVAYTPSEHEYYGEIYISRR